MRADPPRSSILRGADDPVRLTHSSRLRTSSVALHACCWALIFCFLELHDTYRIYDAFNHMRRRGALPPPRVPTKYHLPSSPGATGRSSEKSAKFCLGSIDSIPATVHQFLISIPPEETITQVFLARCHFVIFSLLSSRGLINFLPCLDGTRTKRKGEVSLGRCYFFRAAHGVHLDRVGHFFHFGSRIGQVSFLLPICRTRARAPFAPGSPSAHHHRRICIPPREIRLIDSPA